MEEMTKERLEKYRSKKAEIPELRRKLADLGKGDYRKGYPRPQSVVGYDYEREVKLRETWEKKIERLEKECLEVELWIEEISDSLTRRIFRMKYVDGMTQRQISRKVKLDQSNVSRKIDQFLKIASNA